MADVKIRFAVNPDAETEKLGDIYVDNVDKVSNTSFAIDDDGKYQEQPAEAINGVEALSWAKGYLVFNANGYLANEDTQSGVLTSEQEPQEFVWGATDSNGYYEVKVSFRNATNLDAVVFYGDTVANQFPTMAFLDNSTDPIYSDDARWAIKFSEQSAEHSIRFVQWNRPNYNAVLTKIAVMPAYVEIDKYSGLKSVESLSQSTGQPKEIFYGIVPSTGTIEVVDVGGEIEDMVRDGVIPVSNMPVEILVNENSVQYHISTETSYSLQSRLLNLNLTAKLESWENIKFYYGKCGYYTYILLSVLASALSLVGYKDEMTKIFTENYTPYILAEQIIIGSGENVFKTSVKDYLMKIRSPLGYMYSNGTNVREIVDEICTIAQLNLIEQDDGRLRFVSARPIIDADVNIIHLPKRSQKSVPDRDLFIKNKYNNAKIVESVLTHSFGAILNEDYYLRDDDNNLDYSQIGDDVQILEDNDNYYVCFFKTATTNGALSRFDNSIYSQSVKPISFEFEFENMSMSANRGGVGFPTSNLSKEEFVFNTSMGADGAIRLTQYSTLTSETFAICARYPKLTPSNENSVVTKLHISIYGNQYSLSNREVVLNDNSNICELSFSDGLMTSSLYCNNYGFGNINMYSMIANNIVSDYSMGINTLNLSVACLNYYDNNGILVKDWSKGEILQVGDIVQVDKDNNGTSAVTYASGEPMRFRITGRTFRKQGVPMLDLELQEVKLVQV